MASDAGERPALFSLPNLLILALLATGFIVARQPLQSPRPTTTRVEGQASDKEDSGRPDRHNVAEVPLWEDPFAAVDRFDRPEPRAPRNQPRGRTAWESLWAPRKADQKMKRVLFVMTSFAQTQEGVENRLRSRQAVIGALRSERFTPVHPGYLFHLTIPRDELFWDAAGVESGEDKPHSAYVPEMQARSGLAREAIAFAAFRKPVHPLPVGFAQVTPDAAFQPLDLGDQQPSVQNLPRSMDEVVVFPYEWFSHDEVRKRAGFSGSLDYVLVVWLPEGKFGSENLAALQTSMREIERRLRVASRDSRSFHPPALEGDAPAPPAPEVDPSAQMPSTSTPVSLSSVREREHIDADTDDDDDLVSFALIGPTSSTTLRSMYEEAERCADESRPLDQIERLSTYVTGPSTEPFFLTSFEEIQSYSSLGSLKEAFGEKFGMHRFVRVSETDDAIAEALIEELLQRGLQVVPSSDDWKIAQSNRDGEKLDNIALICEHETLFGRAFAQTFSAALWHRAERDGQSYRERDGLWRQSHASRPPHVRVYFYPRGINVEFSQSGQSDEKDQQNGLPSATSPRSPEPPEGPGQVDYIRRLAQSVSAEYRRAGRNRLRAVGIIGTDVYDKMLLLQALRTECPDVLFFTTDLDARLMHYKSFRYTRNLIVASSYGLTLRERYQSTSGIASFRDSGQTTTYVACRLAISADRGGVRANAGLNPDEHGVILPEQVRQSIHQPLVFEIGHEVAATLSPAVQESDSLHPAAHDELKASYWFLSATAVILFLTMGVFVFPPVRDRLSSLAYSLSRKLKLRPTEDPLHYTPRRADEHRTLHERRRVLLVWVSVIAAVTAVMLLVMVPLSHYGGGEPFAISAGYSSWPSIVITHVALVLTLYFLVESWYTMRVNQHDLDTQFHLRGDDVPARTALFFPLSMWKPQPRHGGIDVDQLWEQYKSLGNWRNRAARVGIMFAVLTAFWITMYLLFGPSNDPLRGGVNRLCGRLVSIGALAGLALLTLYVVDATTLVLGFVRNLAGNQSRYKTETLRMLWTSHFTEESVPAEEASSQNVSSDNLNRIVQYADIAVIGELTSSIFRVILYPFIVLTLMILARASIFDNFTWSTVLATVYGMLFAYTLWCAVVLQRTAERTRRQAIGVLQQKLDAAQRGNQRNSKAAVLLYQATIRQIENVRQGAFMSLSDNPLLRAVLIPTGGTTLVALIKYFSITAR